MSDKKQAILIVDDRFEVYLKLRPILKERYDDIGYASTEKRALEMMENCEYRGVITDYHLGPESPKGGLNIIKAAKAKGLSAILMSTENHRQEALEAGADQFIFKKELIKWKTKKINLPD